MKLGPVCLDPGDAVEVGELLEFLRHWLVGNQDRPAASLRRFVGRDGYDIDELQADLSRLALLLGNDEGELLLDGYER